MSADFEIWPQLAAGKTELLKWPLSLVLLMEDKNFPWIVLVRRVPAAFATRSGYASDIIAILVFWSRRRARGWSPWSRPEPAPQLPPRCLGATG